MPQGLPVHIRTWTQSEASLEQAVKQGIVTWGLVVQPGSAGIANATFLLLGANTSLRGQPAENVVMLLTHALLVPRLIGAGVKPTSAAAVLAPPPIETRIVHGHRFVAPTMATFLVYTLIIVLFVAILFYGQMLMSGVSVEKTSRVSEILLVRVSPRELLTGKVVGQGLAGLMQFLLLGLAALGLYLFDPAIHRLVTGGTATTHLPLWGVALALVFFLCGFFLYGSLFAALGSAVSQPEEVRGAAGLPAMVVVVAYLLAVFGMADPGNRIVTILSFVPAFTPWLMFERMMMTPVPWWQPSAAIGLTLVTGYLMMRWAARIYQRNLLQFRPFSLKSLFARY